MRGNKVSARHRDRLNGDTVSMDIVAPQFRRGHLSRLDSLPIRHMSNDFGPNPNGQVSVGIGDRLILQISDQLSGCLMQAS